LGGSARNPTQREDKPEKRAKKEAARKDPPKVDASARVRRFKAQWESYPDTGKKGETGELRTPLWNLLP